jgi:subtilisin family serine protease/flagellar hook assembly protein FlgD
MPVAKPVLVAIATFTLMAGATPSALAGTGAAKTLALRTHLAATAVHVAGIKQAPESLVKSLAGATASDGSVVLVAHARPGTSLSSLLTVARLQGVSVRKQLTALGDVSFRVPVAKAAAVAGQLLGQPGVASVTPAVLRYPTSVPNDTYFASEQSTYLNAVNAPAAWSAEPGSPSVKIAIVDTGVDTGHPDLAGKIVGQYNAVDGSGNVTDATGHGTFVAGVAAAVTNNALGVAGAGDASSLLAVKVEDVNGDIYSDAVAAGVTWATDHGAKIINLSLGSAQSDPTEQAAITYAQNHGVVVVAAAGNSGNSGNPVSYPAGYPSVLAVGATDAQGGRATFSEYGNWVSVGAPGVNIFSTAPRAGSDFFNPSYDMGDGTSFSSPLVAGEVALLAAAAPDATAADLRNAVISSAHGYANLGLGTGQVDFLAALNELTPATAPAISTPVNGASLNGTIPLTATSSAPLVRFRLDGNWLAGAVTVNGGIATSSWATWGTNNGSHSLVAVDCTTFGACAASGASVVVNVNNTSPAVTAPASGRLVTGAFTMTATAPGGGVAFLVDGVRRGFDANAPYSAVVNATLTDGSHVITAVECSTDGTRCNGPSSLATSFRSLSLHPTFSSLLPATFSPNGDGRLETTKATFVLPDIETVVATVRNSAGVAVRALSLGSLGAGVRSWSWNGRNNAGVRVADGAYTLTLTTTRPVSGTVAYGSVARAVRIDTAAPAISSVTGNGATVYPVVDGYVDSFVPAFSLGEAGTLTLTVRTASGTLIRSLSVGRAAGRTAITWNGRSATNALLFPGSYRWTLSAVDAAGNLRATPGYVINVSAKKLVAKTASFREYGAAFDNIGDSPSGCGDASTALSDYAPDGLWIDNFCDWGDYGSSITAAFYSFAVPGAVGYNSLRLDVFGNTISPGTKLRGALVNQATNSIDSVTAGAQVNNMSDGWFNLGTQAATSLVSSSRGVEAAVVVTNEVASPSDFDIGIVQLTVGYSVLQ